MSRKQKKSGFVGSLGIIFEIIKKIMDALSTLGGTDEDLHRVLTEPNLAAKIAELIMAGRQKVRKTYQVIVDYSLDLAEMIKLGKYVWVNNDINDKRFELQGAGQHEVELVLVHLNQSATTKEVLAHMNAQGLEPARIEHLLSFGATYPELQLQFPIIALGSSFVHDDGVRGYPFLGGGDGRRRLLLGWDGDDVRWVGACRFLAVRK